MTTKKALKIGLFGLGAVTGFAAVGVLILLRSGPKPEDFRHLETPRIVEKADQRVIRADFDGDPETVIKDAYGKLFSVFYGLDGVSKWPGAVAPLARYHDFDQLLAKVGEGKLKEVPWRGFVALPVPPSVTSLPAEAGEGPYSVRLETLAYGSVAEIVHFGPYEAEPPTIQRLAGYIGDQGYEYVGLHEEEYIKGPGLLPVDPQDYITIIRYQVRKRGAVATADP